MKELVACYFSKFNCVEGTPTELYSKFCEFDLNPVDLWLHNQFKTSVKKCNETSTTHRRQGNIYFAKKNLTKSLEYYTKSLCFAILNGKEYGLALANRSAVFFEMNDYGNCLQDIDLCFNTNYPTELKPKILIRRAECYAILNQKDRLNACISELFNFLNMELVPEKNRYLLKLNQIKNIQARQLEKDANDLLYEIPRFPDGESKNLAFASKKIQMRYNSQFGRHIIAKTKIRRGDLLFIEKAFIFAPVFNKTKEFNRSKCYHCLKDTFSSIPCASCTICVYCDQHCQKSSWEQCHKFECAGMQANIWFELGVAFPAFKAMLKGISSGFQNLDQTFEDDVQKFGSKTDNYSYFNRLLWHPHKTKNVIADILMAVTVVTYLEKYTDFFPSLLTLDNCPKKDLNSLKIFIGARIMQHISQLVYDAGAIEFWTTSSSDVLLPEVLLTAACAIFPSVSIMNHSCKPNVTNFFICDTIVVKAREDINEDEQIFNCYGIDYRAMAREQRQQSCKQLYGFECRCVICGNPANELTMLDSFQCHKCRGMLPDCKNDFSQCLNCGEKNELSPFKKIYNQIQDCPESDSVKYLESLMKNLKIKEKILFKYHEDFADIYYKLYNYYYKNGDATNMLKYFNLMLENEKAKQGNNSREIGVKLYETAIAILHCLQHGQTKNCIQLKDFLQKVECMIREAKEILNLYYPVYITNKLTKKIELISVK